MSSRRFLDALTAATIMLLVVAPTIDELVREAEVRGPREHEMRAAAEFPRWPASVQGFTAVPRAIQAWFDDFLGLRDVLIRWHSIVNLFVFDRSPSEEMAVGRDSWMFYRGERSLEIARGVAPFSLQELEIWRRTLEGQRDAAVALGSKYLLVFAPNKESIYPEKLPAWADKVGPSRLDQLLAHLRARSTIEIVDLRETLLDAKHLDRDGDVTYFPQGTHWYGRGTLAAYGAILTALKPHFPVLEPLRGDGLLESEYGQDSWAHRLHVFDRFPQSCLSFVPRAPRAHVVKQSPNWPDGERITEVDDESLPRAVFVHDPMLSYFEPLIAEHFRSATFLWTDRFDVGRIALAKPDVVVVMHVERCLQNDRATGRQAFNDTLAVRRELERAAIPIFELADADQRDLVPRGGMEITWRDSRPELLVRGFAGQLELPRADLRGCQQVFAWLEIETTEAAYIALAHRAAGESEYKRATLMKNDLTPGRTTVGWQLAAPGDDVYFALVSGHTGAPLVLHGLTIRGSKSP